MLLLLSTTVTASFFDSLNPSAIAQQMLLQAMVKNKRHIWFFICGIGLANLIMGLAIYLGIAEWLSRVFKIIINTYSMQVYILSIICGLIATFIGIRLIIKIRQRNVDAEGEIQVRRPPAQLSPASLFIIGAAFCVVELTSALPYFGFLAMLASYHLAFPLAIAFILVYTLIYVSPLAILYFGYNKLKGTKTIDKLEKMLSKVSLYIVPAAITIVGAFMIYYGIASFV